MRRITLTTVQRNRTIMLILLSRLLRIPTLTLTRHDQVTTTPKQYTSIPPTSLTIKVTKQHTDQASVNRQLWTLLYRGINSVMSYHLEEKEDFAGTGVRSCMRDFTKRFQLALWRSRQTTFAAANEDGVAVHIGPVTLIAQLRAASKPNFKFSDFHNNMLMPKCNAQ